MSDKKVLIMDDDADLCMLMETMVKFMKVPCMRNTNPITLEEVLDSYKPNVLVMDMLMSGRDGRDICKLIKSNPAYNNMKVMMVSAHPEAEKTCLEAGADSFLSKPFEMDEFTERVAEMLA